MKATKSSHISATQAARTFSDLLNRVQYRGESFLIERGGEPICEIGPVRPYRCLGSDLRELLSALPRVDDAYLDEVEELTRDQPSLPESPWQR